jgi:hypothetical protein
MALPPIPRNDWLYGAVEGYSHWKEVIYQDAQPRENGRRNKYWADADTSSLKICYKNTQTGALHWENALPDRIRPLGPHEEEVQRVARVFQHKPPSIVLIGSAFMLSGLAVVTAPFYLLYRAKIILARSCEYGFVGTISRLGKMILLMIAYIFANIKTMIEGLFVIHPINGEKLIGEIELELNERFPINEAEWSIGGRQADYNKELDPGWYYFLGCMQSGAVAILDKNNEVIGVRSYNGNRGFEMTAQAQFDPYGSIAFTWEVIPDFISNACCFCF